MKTKYNIKKLMLFLTVLIFSSASLTAQYDYVSITEGSSIYNKNACIDDQDNIYTFGDDIGYTRVLRKFDASGNLDWTKDVSSLISYSAVVGYGGIEYHNNNVYAIGNNSGNSVIVESGLSSSPTATIWDTVNSSGSITFRDIKIKNGFMYITGHFATSGSSSTTLTFFDGTTLTGVNGSSFILKYAIAPKTLVWAKKIDGNNGIRSRNIDVDDNGNVFISGDYTGTSIFYDNGTPFPYTSNDTIAFLAKFDSNGEFDSSYGLKYTNITYGYWDAFDVEVDNTNNAVVWSVRNAILSHSSTGSGAHLWTVNLPSSAYPYGIETNGCGDLYVTGESGFDLTRDQANKAPCAGDFFGISLDAANGNTIWSSNSSSCISNGTQVLIDSNNKEVFVGNYFHGGDPQILNIDSTYQSTTTAGYFIARYDDSDVNSCCDDTIDLGSNQTVCAGGSFPTLDISSQISGSPTITWSLNGNTVQNGGNTLSTSTYGTYSVEVVYSAECTATGSMSVNNNGCCDQDVNIGSDIAICDDEPWPTLNITGQISGFTSIQWYLNGQSFPQNSNSETVTTVGAGTYTVVVTYGDGCTTSDAMVLTVNDCDPDCNVKPSFKLKIKDCKISITNLSAPTNGGQIIGYLWDFGDGTTSTAVNPMHTYLAGGSYIITLSVYGIDSNGDCCVKQIQRQVYIAQSCIPKCKMKPGFSVNGVGNGVSMFTSTSATNGFTTIVGYEWTIDGVVVSNDAYFAQPFNGGLVCLTIYGMTNKGDCCMERTCKEVPASHQPEKMVSEDQVKIYPNPSKDSFKIDLRQVEVNQIKEISIFDMYGRLVKQLSNIKSIENIDATSWPSGVYICEIQMLNEKMTKKIIKN